MINYREKYLKYKNKYLEIKNQIGGGGNEDEINNILAKLKILKDSKSINTDKSSSIPNSTSSVVNDVSSNAVSNSTQPSSVSSNDVSSNAVSNSTQPSSVSSNAIPNSTQSSSAVSSSATSMTYHPEIVKDLIKIDGYIEEYKTNNPELFDGGEFNINNICSELFDGGEFNISNICRNDSLKVCQLKLLGTYGYTELFLKTIWDTFIGCIKEDDDFKILSLIMSLKLLNKFGDINNLPDEKISSIYNLKSLFNNELDISYSFEEKKNKLMEDIKKMIRIMSNPAPFIDPNKRSNRNNCRKYLKSVSSSATQDRTQSNSADNAVSSSATSITYHPKIVEDLIKIDGYIKTYKTNNPELFDGEELDGEEFSYKCGNSSFIGDCCKRELFSTNGFDKLLFDTRSNTFIDYIKKYDDRETLMCLILSLKLLNKFGDINNLPGEKISLIYNLKSLITYTEPGISPDSYAETEEQKNKFMEDIQKLISIMSNPAPFIDKNSNFGTDYRKYL